MRASRWRRALNGLMKVILRQFTLDDIIIYLRSVMYFMRMSQKDHILHKLPQHTSAN